MNKEEIIKKAKLKLDDLWEDFDCGVITDVIFENNAFKLFEEELSKAYLAGNGKRFTPDGFEIVYISEFLFDTLEKAMESVAHGYYTDMNTPPIALRDAKGLIEFRRLEKKEFFEKTEANHAELQ